MGEDPALTGPGKGLGKRFLDWPGLRAAATCAPICNRFHATSPPFSSVTQTVNWPAGP